MCWITQRGIDGIGHQLFGTLTLMSLNNVTLDNQHIQYDACTKRKYTFAHVSNKTQYNQLENYYKSSLKLFCDKTPVPSEPKKTVHLPKSIYNVNWMSVPCKKNILYSIDQVYFENVALLMEKNKKVFEEVFTTNLSYPSHFSKKLKNVVVHVRLGDASNRGENYKINKITHDVIEKIKRIEKNVKIWVHTDEPQNSFFTKTNKNYNVCDGKNCGNTVLDALRDMIYSDVLVISDSSFSRFAAWINKKSKLLIGPKNIFPAYRKNPIQCMPAKMIEPYYFINNY